MLCRFFIYLYMIVKRYNGSQSVSQDLVLSCGRGDRRLDAIVTYD